MASYILKKSTKARGLYLQIYKAEYDSVTKNTRNFSYKKIGYVSDLIESGIEDPVSYYKKEVEELNRQLHFEENNKEVKIGNTKPSKLFGYFPLKKILKELEIENKINNKKLFDLFQTLVFASVVYPKAKKSEYLNLLTRLEKKDCKFSYEQIFECEKILSKEYVDIIDSSYEKIHEIYNTKIDKVFYKTTSFYFDSNEKQDNSSLTNMAFLVDRDFVSMSMKLDLENSSENTLMNNMTEKLKENGIVGNKVVEVSDKALYGFDNVIDAIKQGHGYICLKSTDALSKEDREEFLKGFDLEDKERMSKDGWKTLESDGKIKYYYKSKLQDVDYEVLDKKETFKEKRIVYRDMNKKNTSDSLEYNMIVTSEVDMADEEIFDAYYKVGCIEDSIKDFKDNLYKSPIYDKSEDSLKFNFLVSFIVMQIMKVLKTFILKDEYESFEICKFIKEFEVLKEGDRKYINLSDSSKVLDSIKDYYKIPIDNFYLSSSEVLDMLS